MRKLYHPVGTAANQAFIQSRVAGSADDQEFDAVIPGKVDDVADGMTRHDMAVKFELTSLAG
jgi:hypothetical protein